MKNPIENDAYKLLMKNDPEGALHLYRQVSKDYRLYENAFIPSEYFIDDLPFVAKITDVIVDTDEWFAFKDKKLYSFQTSSLNPYNHPLIQERITPDQRYVILKEPKPDITIKEPSVFIGGDYNYCHWFLRYLMRFHLFENNPEYNKLPLVVTSELRPFQKETLEMLGIPEERLIKLEPNQLVLFKELVLPECTRQPRFMKSGCAWIREQFLKEEGKLKRRIYVSRSHTDHQRYITNEKQVRELLEKHGFETVNPGEHSVKEQIKIFSEASVIIGSHGAGLTNAIFAPKSCKVVEFATPMNQQMYDFELICMGVGLPHHKLMSYKFEILNHNNHANNHNFEVNLDDLKCVLKKIEDDF